MTAATELAAVFDRVVWTGFLADLDVVRRVVLVNGDSHRGRGRAVAKEALELGLLTGWIAFLVFIALAATSNDVSVRAMGRKWRALHKAVYAAAVLTFLHWALTAFDPTAGLLHSAVMIILLLIRAQFVIRSRG